MSRSRGGTLFATATLSNRTASSARRQRRMCMRSWKSARETISCSERSRPSRGAKSTSSCRLPRCSTSSREGVVRKKSGNSGPKLFDWLLVGALQNIALRKLRMRVEISVLGCERDFHFVDNFFRTKFKARQLCTLGESSDGLSDRGFSYALGIVEQADLESASRCS